MIGQTHSVAKGGLGMRWKSLKILGLAGITVALLVGVSCIAFATPSMWAVPDALLQAPSPTTGSTARINVTGMDPTKWYKITATIPDGSGGTDTGETGAFQVASTTTVKTVVYGAGNTNDFDTSRTTALGRYEFNLWVSDSQGGPWTQVSGETVYLYVIKDLKVTPKPDGVIEGDTNPVRITVETADVFPDTGAGVPHTGETFTVQMDLVHPTSGVVATGAATLVFIDSDTATTAGSGGSPASINTASLTPDRYEVDSEETDGSGDFFTTDGVAGTHDYIYVFNSSDVAKIEVQHPNALFNDSQQENTATTFNIDISFTGTHVSATTTETVTIQVRETAATASAYLYGWNSSTAPSGPQDATVTLTANSGSNFSATNVKLGHLSSPPVGTYTLHAYENTDPPQFPDDTSAVHPYLFIIHQLNINVDAPDAFFSGASDQTTFDVESTTGFTDPTNGQTPYTATVAISFDSSSVYISPATTTLTLVLSSTTTKLVSYDTTLVYNKDLGVPATPRVSFVIWENWSSSDENPNTTDPWYHPSFPGDQFDLRAGHPYIYVLSGNFDFYVYAPDAFAEGASDDTTFDAWYSGPILGASGGDTITIRVNDQKAPATPASCLVAAANSNGSNFNKPVTLTYDTTDQRFELSGETVFVKSSALAGRYLLYAQEYKPAGVGDYWETNDTGASGTHPYLYVLDATPSSTNGSGGIY
ncbi:hypothetical protein J7K97_04050, partial [Candidatus Aerophobetes bacterium]|nr:hypothetical protein [Candidatus Aerophobetes bacterium]